MADDNVDFRFLGRQVQNLQGDVRDLRAGHLRLESDVAGLRADVSRLEGRVERLEGEMRAGFEAVDACFNDLEASLNIRFDQARQMTATNFQILLAAIQGRDGGAG